MNEFKLSGYVNYPKEVSEKLTTLSLSFRLKKDEPSHFVRVKLIGKAREKYHANNLEVSDQIEIQGFVATSSYEKDGQKIRNVDFVATDLTDFKTKKMKQEERQEELAF